MNHEQKLQKKILKRSELIQQVTEWKRQREKIVFTNGCFDILHVGHISSLLEAASHGSKLIVGVNSDRSVKSLKGADRPLNNQDSRTVLLAALSMVDAVIVFEEETPRELIVAIQPDVLVKGGDYKVEDIAGAAEVIASGGQVIINPIVPGFSTSNIINRIRTL